MHFAPDVEETLGFTAALINTAPAASRSGFDELASVDELRRLLAANRYTSSRDYTEHERTLVVETRDLLGRLWSIGRDDLAAGVNRILRESDARPQLLRHDDFDWHIHAIPLDAPVAERIRVETALALADIIRAKATDRLRTCAAPDCGGALVDMSRNGSKRFCSIRCGNRMSMMAYRERRADGMLLAIRTNSG